MERQDAATGQCGTQAISRGNLIELQYNSFEYPFWAGNVSCLGRVLLANSIGQKVEHDYRIPSCRACRGGHHRFRAGHPGLREAEARTNAGVGTIAANDVWQSVANAGARTIVSDDAWQFVANAGVGLEWQQL